MWDERLKESHKLIYINNAENEAKRLIATTFVIAKLRE